MVVFDVSGSDVSGGNASPLCRMYRDRLKISLPQARHCSRKWLLIPITRKL